MANSRWSQLSPRTRRILIVAATIEGFLKIAALVDLARRPRKQVRGSKLKWAAAIIVINSGGVLPVRYFTRGRIT